MRLHVRLLIAATIVLGIYVGAIGIPKLLATPDVIVKFSSAGTIIDSVVTDDGTTFKINTNKLTVTEASGNTAIAGTLTTTSDLFSANGGLTSTAGITTIGGLADTIQSETTTTGPILDWTMNANTTSVMWDASGGGSNLNVDGLTGGTDGRYLALINASSSGSHGMTLLNNNGSAQVGNRMWHAGGAANVLLVSAANQSAGVIFQYNATRSRWMEVARTGPRFDYIVNLQLGMQLSSNGSTAGRLDDNAALPTLSTCGTSPSVTGGANHFTITTGTGATACTASFASSLVNPSTCTMTSQSGTQPAYSFSNPSIILGAGTTASTKYDVSCTIH